MASLGTFIAGRYSASYTPPSSTGMDFGVVQKGYELQINYKKELINDTDAYADTVVDGIFRGADVFLQATTKEYKTSSLAAVTPFQSTNAGVYTAFAATGANKFYVGLVGRLDTSMSGQMVLTSTTGTAAASTPATLTSTNAIFAENFDIRTLLGPTLRLLPARWRFLPYTSTDLIFFSTT